MNTSDVEKIFEINTKKTFTLSEVNDLVLVIVKITENAKTEVQHILNQLEALPDKTSIRAQELQSQINFVVDRWQNKIEKLGGQPKGLWLADFDFGAGYFCWKFPENKISFWHGYQDGFSGRKPIESLIP